MTYTQPRPPADISCPPRSSAFACHSPPCTINMHWAADGWQQHLWGRGGGLDSFLSRLQKQFSVWMQSRYVNSISNFSLLRPLPPPPPFKTQLCLVCNSVSHTGISKQISSTLQQWKKQGWCVCVQGVYSALPSLLLCCCQLLRHCWNRVMGELWPKGAFGGGGVHFFIVTAAPPILWLSTLPLGIRLSGHASDRHSQHDHQYPTPAVCTHQPPHPRGQAQEGFQDITKSDLLCVCVRLCLEGEFVLTPSTSSCDHCGSPLVSLFWASLRGSYEI